MRKPLVIALLVLSAASVRGEEATPTTMRQKLSAKVLASVPAAAVEKKAEEPVPAEGTVVKMEAFTVVESARARALHSAINREKDKIEAEQFSVSKGGTIYKGKRVELGGWWDNTTGWQFMRISW